MPEAPILQAECLTYSYDGHTPALRGVSLAVHAGERIAVLGCNGAGKSTFFLCLDGVLTPESGTIRLHGQAIGRRDLPRLRSQVGVVFQNADDQIIASSVQAEVSFGPMNLRLPRDAVAQRVTRALEQMELSDYRLRPPHDLSGGEKKRVSIADILAMESEIILFDEPCASLDPAGAAMLEQVLARLADDGKTLLISTHDMDFAFRWASRIVVFADGQIIADGAPEDVFRDRQTLARARLQPPVLLTVADLLRARGLLPLDAPTPRTPDGLEQLLG